MTDMIYTKRHNTYRRLDGVISAWSRNTDPDGHNVIIVDRNQESHHIRWRAPEDPTAGDQVSLIMVESGISAKKQRPALILNHTTGHAHREQNAPEPKSITSIMVALVGWVTIAMIISAVIILNAEGVIMLSLLLIAAAMIVWRLAIATSEVRYNEKAVQRKHDEEILCSEIVSNEWRGATASRKPRMDMNNTPDKETPG